MAAINKWAARVCIIFLRQPNYHLEHTVKYDQMRSSLDPEVIIQAQIWKDSSEAILYSSEFSFVNIASEKLNGIFSRFPLHLFN
jgi:hypothetical protein